MYIRIYAVRTLLPVLVFKQKSSSIDIPYTPCTVSHAMSPLSVLLVAAALLHCGLTTTPATGVHITNTELISGYDLKQWLAYHIGRVECLKTLLSEGNTQYGLGAILHGNYTTDITRFSLRQQTAFLTGVVQCFNFHLSLEGNRTNTSDNCNNHRME